MVNVLQIVNKALAYAGRPLEDYPGLSDILEFLYGHIDFYRTMLSIANRNWLINRYVFTVTPGVDEYSVSTQAGDFARPILVETYDESLPNFERRPIDIVEIQNASLRYPDIVNPTGYFPSDYYKHTARAFAFWGYESADIKVKVIPQAVLAADYRVWYEPGKAADPQLTDAPLMMPDFHDLLALHTGKSIAGRARWFAAKDYPNISPQELMQMDSQKRQDILAAIDPDLADRQKLFERYSRNNKLERAAQRQPFNNYRYQGFRTR